MRIYDPRSDAYSDIEAPHQVMEKDRNIVFVRKSPGGNTTFHLCKTNFQFLQHSSSGVTRLETFAMGINHNHSEIAETAPAAYVHTQIQGICEAWDTILQYSKSLLSAINREVLTEGDEIERELVRRLFQTAEIWEKLRELHQQQMDSLKFLKTKEGNEAWFRNTKPAHIDNNAANEPDEGFERLQEALKRLETIGIGISENLVKETTALISKTHDLISIDEAYRSRQEAYISRQQNASMKRLTWITFIFLPLLFIASLYGMNVDLLENNPAYTTFFYFAAPLFVILMICVIVMKNIDDIQKYLKNSATRLGKNLQWLCRGREATNNDLEMQRPDDNNRKILDESASFLWAAKWGHYHTIDSLLSAGFSSHTVITNALQSSAGGGHLRVVERLLKAGANINAEPAKYNGRTALQAAAEGGHLEVVERLLKEGADVNAEPARSGGRTALQAAAGGGYLEVVEGLLKEGADVNAKPAGQFGRTALQAAAEEGHLEVVERLLKEGADVNVKPGYLNGRTALQAAAGGGHLEVVERLLKEGADVNAKPGYLNGRTALQAAAGGGHLEVVERLLKGGADVNAEPAEYNDGRTALQAAAGGGHLEVVERLLKEGADVNAKPAEYNDGRTALQAAAEGGHLEVVERLLKEGADVNAKPGYLNGRTALQAAAGGGHLEVVERLLKEGADVNAEPAGQFGRTALQAAADGGYPEVEQRLKQL